ncbi:MAG: penicillin-binding protein 2 [Burkholderiales bacterium]|nr:penicillin-binding protein 2 [Burkholderiales bacterium]
MNKSRVVAAYLFIICGLLVLALRYAWLQVSDHNILLQKSINNYSSVVATQPTRGVIMDSESVILADNKLSYAVAILPKYSRNNIESVFDFLSSRINLTAFDKKNYYKQLNISKNYDWVIIKDGLSNIEVAKLVADSYQMPNLNVFGHTKRYYPFQDLYAHSIGYVGRISQKDKSKIESAGNEKNYMSNDYFGKSGIEQYYESDLRGFMGKKVIRTDAYGNEVGLIANTPATDGYALQLTINNRLQQKASQLLGSRKGAIVAIDPQTGGVLAFVSKPSYDANLFLDGISPSDWEDLREDDRNPLLNRASQGTYPPGSTFKPFLAAVSLYAGVRSPSYRFNDIGYFTLPGSTHRFRNSGDEVLGNINIVDAVAHSSDAFFYKLGLDMGVDRMNKTLSMFSFGAKTGIDLPQENTGLLPSRAWKAKRFAKNPYQKNWLPADSVTMGVGQGFNHYTPLQMAFATSILANSGTVRRPHFLDKILKKDGSIYYTYNESAGHLPISKSDLTLIQNGMVRVMQVGTGKRVGAGAAYSMAGKTGTAQVVGLQQGSRKSKFSGEKYKDHSWFIAYAPVENPKIAIAVIVENAGFGAAVAGPIVRQVFDTYLLKHSVVSNESAVLEPTYKKFKPEKEQVNPIKHEDNVIDNDLQEEEQGDLNEQSDSE